MLRRTHFLAPAFVALLSVVACGDSPVATHDATAPETAVSAARPATTSATDDGGGSGANADPAGLARFRDGAPSITIGWAKKTIGPEGGSLRLLDFEIVVPPGAVDRDTRFQIRLPVDPHEREYVMAEFGPHGRDFAVPVQIRFPFQGTTIEGSDEAGVVWWNGDGWVRLSTGVIESGARLEASTDHFSTYGTSDEALIAEMSSGG